ncbi:MAG: permease [Clostridia bacterium]|nr:permease [Clostridia bacterium]
MIETLHREFVYLWYYTTVLLEQIAPYWITGMLAGSLISVFFKEKMVAMIGRMVNIRYNIIGILIASAIGIVSPLCMYGTIPIAAGLASKGLREDWIAAFMMSSVLLNPQLLIYSASLGKTAVIVRLVSCFLCGIVAGLLVRLFFKKKRFFNFDGFAEAVNRDTDPRLFVRFLKNLGRNIKKTAPYFALGIVLAVLFERYVPQDTFVSLFGEYKRFGVLLAAAMGVPAYACGGGTIPLLRSWLNAGMTMGAASAFMITGPATKLTNLTALKIVIGVRNFVIYIVFAMLFAMATGFVVDILVV